MVVLHGKILLAGALLVGMISPPAGLNVGLRAGALNVSAVATPQAPLRSFSADLIIRHRRVTLEGTSIGATRPDVVLHVLRERRGQRWVTTLTADRMPAPLVDVPGGPSRLSNPFLVARVELADDEEHPRLFDRRGQPVRALTSDDLRLVGAARTVRGERQEAPGRGRAGGVFLAGAGDQAERRLDLARRYGAPAGRVRGLDRYVSTTADGRHEVLVTTDTALPVELFTSSSTAGYMRTGITYEAYGSYGHVRRLMRSEHHFVEAGAGRSATEVELANVVLSSEVRP